MRFLSFQWVFSWLWLSVFNTPGTALKTSVTSLESFGHRALSYLPPWHHPVIYLHPPFAWLNVLQELSLSSIFLLFHPFLETYLIDFWVKFKLIMGFKGFFFFFPANLSKCPLLAPPWVLLYLQISKMLSFLLPLELSMLPSSRWEEVCFWSSCCGATGLVVSLQCHDGGSIPSPVQGIKGSGVATTAAWI